MKVRKVPMRTCVVTHEKLEKKELVLKDIEGCDCQQKTTEKIKEIDKELENAKPKSKYKAFKEAKPITE